MESCHTVTLRLVACPGAVCLATALRGASQNVPQLTAEPHSTAHRELLAQPDTVGGHTGVATHAKELPWKTGHKKANVGLKCTVNSL